MILEEYVDKGILLTQLLRASMVTPITFDQGQVKVDGRTFGNEGEWLTTHETLIYAIDAAYSSKKRG